VALLVLLENGLRCQLLVYGGMDMILNLSD